MKDRVDLFVKFLRRNRRSGSGRQARRAPPLARSPADGAGSAQAVDGRTTVATPPPTNSPVEDVAGTYVDPCYDAFEERAAIAEYDGGLWRPTPNYLAHSKRRPWGMIDRQSWLRWQFTSTAWQSPGGSRRGSFASREGARDAQSSHRRHNRRSSEIGCAIIAVNRVE